MKRKCIKCTKEKELKDFQPNIKSKDNIGNVCKICFSKQKHEYHIKRNGGLLNLKLYGTDKRYCISCHQIKKYEDYPLNGKNKRMYKCKKCMSGFNFSTIQFYQKFDIIIKIDSRIFHKITPVINDKRELRRFINTNVPCLSLPIIDSGVKRQDEFEILLISPAQRGFNKKLKNEIDMRYVLNDGGLAYSKVKSVINARRNKENITINYMRD